VAFVPDGHLMPGTLRRLIRTAGVDTVWLTTIACPIKWVA
jgi:hypothetical protein